MNINIPHFYAMCNGIDNDNNTYECVVHAVRSRSDKVLTFHVHLECGAHYSLLPINKLFHKEGRLPMAVDQMQMWDCFSDDPEVVVYDYFKFKKVYVIPLKMWGEYLMTFDWQNNSFSDYAPEFKQGHLIKLDNGNYGMYPNNYLLFHHKTYTGELDVNKLPILVRQNPSDFISVESLK